MKRTGIKKLELKRLTVKQLSEVSGAGHKVTNMTVSNTCTCMTTGLCVIENQETYHQCDLAQFGMCDGSCVTGAGGGCGGGCGSGGEAGGSRMDCAAAQNEIS
jgi:hypothetical protein